MTQQIGLREHKKLRTRQTLLHTALELFTQRGFDNVTVAEIAAAAEVSTMTVFNYFPTKEDLITAPMEQHVGDLASIVSVRSEGESAVAALRRFFLDGLADRDPVTGLNDDEEVLTLQRLLQATPSLTQRVYAFGMRGRELLAEALTDPSCTDGPEGHAARIAAGQIVGVREILVMENQQLLLGGATADAAYADAVARAEHAFDLLESGLRDFGIRRA
ncbi:TetR/AcrR family transcriptional regulator [Streptomyces sp. BHT-5-2]|uniref:TetR/AcrR family transcriptional regulator n=1 Tax=Streptomyces sp. BHT-5-2 TaxID=2866715 RepID=UPI001C8EEA10|nr:TetR/AcrR family transcriptional regulator [Streptomyces sp. BHT-5-2]QZL06388.1 TetR/AcrR family transcriptional regulator [Streptomyces sp. BHT-5-2]